MFINNEFVDSVSGRTFPTINPCTGEKICDIQEADKVDTAYSSIVPVPGNVSLVISSMTLEKGRASLSHDPYLWQLYYV